MTKQEQFRELPVKDRTCSQTETMTYTKNFLFLEFLEKGFQKRCLKSLAQQLDEF